MNVPLQIPFPQYIVFYNGTKQEPERQELKLSDLFVKTGKEVPPALECKAVVLNINFGHNRELMEKCVTLREYSRFVAMIRQQMSGELPFEVRCCSGVSWETHRYDSDESSGCDCRDPVDFICYTDNARYGTGDKKHDLRDLYCRLDRYGACRTGGDDPFKRNRFCGGGKDRWYIGHSDFV